MQIEKDAIKRNGESSLKGFFKKLNNCIDPV